MQQFQRTEILTHQLKKSEFIAAVTKDGISGFIVGAQPIREELDGYHSEHMVKFIPGSKEETRVIRLSAFRDVNAIVEQLDECDVPRIEEPYRPTTAVYAEEKRKPADIKKPVMATPVRVQPAKSKAATEQRLIETLAGIHNG